MGELIRQFGDGLASFFSSGTIQLGLRIVLAYLVVVWLAAAFWVFRDSHARTTNPVAPYVAAALVLAFSPLLFPFGLVLYRIVRPAERLTEREDRELTRAALVADAAEVASCPGCGRTTAADWLVCPTCGTRLSRRCPTCERGVALDWAICAWCAAELQPEPGIVPETMPRVAVGAGMAGADATAGPIRREPVGVMSALAAVSDSVSAAVSEAVAAVGGAQGTPQPRPIGLGPRERTPLRSRQQLADIAAERKQPA